MSTPIETILGHEFARPELLREAMTHRSALHGRGRRRGKGSNERMEFVGDRVLGLLIAEWLAERFPHEQEGDLGAACRCWCRSRCWPQVAETIGLGEALSVAPGEAKAGVRRRATVLADALEAALGAIFLDGGWSARASSCAARGTTAMSRQETPPKDAKTMLQEWVQARGLGFAGLRGRLALRAAACAGVCGDGDASADSSAPAPAAASARPNNWRRRICCGRCGA